MGTEKLASSEVKSPTPEKVSETVSKIIGDEVTNVTLIDKGAINHPFLVETEKGKLFVRVFSRDSWPEPDKPKWIADQLELNNIPHAEQIFYDRTNRFFPCGIEISEYIEGNDASDVSPEELKYDTFCEKVVKSLHKIHEIEVGGYGFVNSGEGSTSNLNEFLFEMIDKNIDRLSKRVGDVESLGNRCKEAVERKLKPYQDRFKPTLVHSDVHPDNCRYTKDGEVILIDWDNAMLYPWQMDMAIAMYWSWEPETMKKAEMFIL